MRKLLLLLPFILIAQLSRSQDKSFMKLADALQEPGAVTHLVVSCSSNEVQKLVSNIYKLSHVQSIKLEGGDASTDWNAIFSALDKLDHLTDLHLSYAEMKEIPAGIDRLCLQHMTVSGSKNLNYHDLFIHLSRQPALTALSLDHNQLEAIPSGLAEIASIQKLEITDNSGIDIENGMNTFAKLPQLRHLSLKDNDMEELPSSVSSLANLTSLDISGNYIEKLPSSIAKLEWLDSLSLGDNAFKDVISEGQKLASLKNLSFVSLDSDIDEKAVALLRKKLPGVKIELVQDEYDFAVDNMASTPKFHENSLITPPIPSLTIKPSVFNVDAASGGTIQYTSGTKINIPAGALVDAQGNPVTGAVSISYREFQDPLDILLSGIPMTYDSGGAVNQFETAGMFELYASQGDKELFVKPGAKIDVEMASSDAAPSFNFYALNESSKNWDYLGKAGTIRQGDKMNAKSEAWKIYHRLLPHPFPYDVKPYEERYEDTSYFYRTKKNDLYSSWFNRKKTRDEYFYSISPIILKTEKRAKDDRKGIVKFRIAQRVKSNVTLHKEMYPLQDVVLVYDGPMSSSEFRKHFIRKRRFNDIKVSYTPGSSVVSIELKDHKGFESFTATVYSPGDEVSKSAKRKMAFKYKVYKNEIKRQQRQFEKETALGKKKQDQYVAKQEASAWKTARAAMSPGELAMTKSEWLKYYEKMVEASKDAEIVSSGIVRNLSLSGFGVFNCDQVKRLQNPVKVLASYRNEKGEKISSNTTYVLDKNVRGVLTYSGAYAGLQENEIAFDPNSTRSILVVSDNGKVSVMKGEVLKGKTFPRNTEFTMQELGTNLSNINDLKKALGVE